jgi:hypothetical protein
VIQAIVFAKAIERLNGTGLRVQASKDQPAYARLQYRAYAHDAGLQRNINVAVVETPRAQGGRSFLDGADFGMAERALSLLSLIKPPAHHSMARNDHSPNRHFSPRGGLLGFR